MCGRGRRWCEEVLCEIVMRVRCGGVESERQCSVDVWCEGVDDMIKSGVMKINVGRSSKKCILNNGINKQNR